MRDTNHEGAVSDKTVVHRQDAPVRTLSRAYFVGLTFIVGQLIVAQLLVHTYQANQASDTYLVNIAGRQRFLSHRVALLATMVGRGEKDQDSILSELRYATAIWADTHVALRRGDESLGLDPAVREATAVLYEDVEKSHLVIVRAAEDVAAHPNDLPRVAANVARMELELPPYIEGMEWIVLNYTAFAGDRVERLRTLESLLIASVLAVVVIQGLFLFRPLLRRVNTAMEEHGQLELLLVETRDRERRRIGADLHDGLCQVLVGVSCILKSMQPKLSEPFGQQIDQARGFVDDAIAQTRALARGLYPVEVEVNGLIDALETLARSVKTAHGVECRLNLDRAVTRHLQATEALQLYYIAQEALGNAARHSKSPVVELSLVARQGAAVLEVRDQGTGFERGAIATGMGLRTMQLRAELIGAELKMSRPKGGGTQVSCALPLREVTRETPEEDAEEEDPVASVGAEAEKQRAAS